MKEPRFRIIACDAKYDPYSTDDDDKYVFYLQRKRWFGWQTQSGYHRGAPGDYAYEYESAMNPYALINHNIPEVVQELHIPSIHRLRKTSMFLQRVYRRFEPLKIVDLDKATEQLKKHQATNPGPTDFTPPGGIPWKENLNDNQKVDK